VHSLIIIYKITNTKGTLGFISAINLMRQLKLCLMQRTPDEYDFHRFLCELSAFLVASAFKFMPSIVS